MIKKRALIVAAAAAPIAGLLGISSASAQTEPSVYAKLDVGAFALTVKITVAGDKKDDFLTLIDSRVRQSRTNPDVVDFRVFKLVDDPLTFVGFESFQSKAAFEAFTASPESLEFLKQLAPFLTRPPEVQRLLELP